MKLRFIYLFLAFILICISCKKHNLLFSDIVKAKEVVKDVYIDEKIEK